MSKRSDRLTVSQTLHRAIRDSGLSLRELARQSGVDHRAVGRFVSGERGLTNRAVDALAEALGLELTKKKRRRKE